MPIEATNNNGSCGCGSQGSSSAQSLFMGYFESLMQLNTLQPAPTAGSRAMINVENGADIPAFWDAGDNVWRTYDQNNKGKSRHIGTIEGLNPLSEAAALLNGQTFTVRADEAIHIFRAFQANEDFIVTKKYLFLWMGGKGNFGVGGVTVITSNLFLLSAENLNVQDVEEDPAATIISLGELPDGDFLTAANSEPRDFSDAGTVTDDGTATYYFSYTTDDVLYFMLFVGEPGIYGGLGNPEFTESDLVPSTNSNVIPGPSIPTYDEVLEQGNITNRTASHKDSDTGEFLHVHGRGVTHEKDGITTKVLFNTQPGSYEVAVPALEQNDEFLMASSLLAKKIKTVSGTSYTLEAADRYNILHFTSASAVTLTVPAGLPVRGRYEGKQMGAGKVTINGSGTTINKEATDNNKTAGQYSVFALDWTASNTYVLYGKLELL